MHKKWCKQILYIEKNDVLLFCQVYILKPTSNRSTYIFTLVQKVKRRVYKIHIFLSEAILCQDSASYFI